MEPNKLLLDLPLLVWIIVVLGKHGWSVRHPRILWAMTGGALVGNALLYWVVLLPSASVAASVDRVGNVATYLGLVLSHLKWVVIAHLTTRLALVVGDGRPAFASSRGVSSALRSASAGAVVGLLVAASACALVAVQMRAGLLERPPWAVFTDLGFGWELGVAGGMRNLFSEEALTRLGVQTLAIHHLSGRRHAAIWAIAISALYFELWHNPPGALNGINCAMGAAFATAYHRYRYEAAAVAHCVADVVLLSAVPALLST
jgi:hypothetical protein